MVQILNNSYVKVIYIVKILQYYREDVDRWSFLSSSWQQWGGKTTRWEKRQKKEHRQRKQQTIRHHVILKAS